MMQDDTDDEVENSPPSGSIRGRGNTPVDFKKPVSDPLKPDGILATDALKPRYYKNLPAATTGSVFSQPDESTSPDWRYSRKTL